MTFHQKFIMLAQMELADWCSKQADLHRPERTPMEVLCLAIELSIPDVQRLCRLGVRLGVPWVVERFCANALFDPSDVMAWVTEEEMEHARAVAELAAVTEEQGNE